VQRLAPEQSHYPDGSLRHRSRCRLKEVRASPAPPSEIPIEPVRMITDQLALRLD
jgi:hypothetical protein